jgi:hypothetical protein
MYNYWLLTQVVHIVPIGLQKTKPFLRTKRIAGIGKQSLIKYKWEVPKLVLIIFKYLVLSLKKSQPIIITKINWLMLFKKQIAVYSEKRMKPINTLCGRYL